MTRARALVVALLVLSSVAPDAAARRPEGYLHLGLHGLANVHLGDGPQAGWTGGVGLHLTGGFHDPGALWGIGAFTNVQAVGAFDHLRVSFGVQPHWTLAGVEIGASWEQGSGAATSTWGVHIMPFAAFAGLAALGLRINVPVEQGATGYGLDIGIVLCLGFPFESLWGTWARSAPVVR